MSCLSKFSAVLRGCAVVIITTLPVHAQNSAVEGLGTMKCSKVIEAAIDDEVLLAGLGAWVSGFVSAANIYEDATFDLTPWQTPELSMAQVANACKNQPDSNLAEATIAYIRFLKKDRLETQSNFVALRHDGKQILIYAEVLQRICSRLANAGYSLPEVKNDDGGVLLQVITQYQMDQGLAVSGLPDQRTMSRLLK